MHNTFLKRTPMCRNFLKKQNISRETVNTTSFLLSGTSGKDGERNPRTVPQRSEPEAELPRAD